MMSDRTKITSTHLHRSAFVYIRQSTATQLERNPESTRRQYGLVDRAAELGWPRDRISVVDEDQGITGSGIVERSGFTRMTSEVALGHVGLVLGIEVSRLARNNADWYRLLDLCGLTDTLIGDSDGLYHPALFNDRLLLGLKGTMSEAELHVIRARLDGGIRNKAARGELRRGLPVGLLWGEQDGEVCFHPDEAVTGAIRAVFQCFAETGSVRRVWLWLREQKLSFPLQQSYGAAIAWVSPTYTAIHHVLTNPVYAGAYAYGKTRHERFVDELGNVKKRVRHLPRSEWQVLIPDHHRGFIDWETFQANQARIARNTRPMRHHAGGAVREGAALLQGIATCGSCGRRLKVYYQGKNSTHGYHCSGNILVNGRGTYCLRVGGRRVDDAVVAAFLDAITPVAVEATLCAEASIGAERDAALEQHRLEVERLRYETQKAERRYRSVEPENRLVARGLEAQWEKSLRELDAAEAELQRRAHKRPRTLGAEEREAIGALGSDLRRVWSTATTIDRDRKELLQTLLEEVNISVEKSEFTAHAILRWRGGAVSETNINLRQCRVPALRTDEDTVALVRRLALHYPDTMIAGILNRQERRTAAGLRFDTNRVGNLRRHWKIPNHTAAIEHSVGELATLERAAEILDVAPSTLYRWLNDGFIAGEQLTPGAPWRIRITDELRSRFVEQEPDGYLPMWETMKALAVSRQTVLQRVKRGELKAVYIRRGKRKGLRIKVIDSQPGLFDQLS